MPTKSKPPAADGAADQDDADEDYIFTPVLDEARDAFVISLLPDYLRNEISFSREHAARFYLKINDVLQRVPKTDADTEEYESDVGDETGYTQYTHAAETTMAEGDVTMADE